MLKADVYHYNTLSDGIKRIYTNDDELKEYGNRGILNPHEVSYYSLYINGILQPKVNYEIQEGLLILKTEDIPVKNSTIIITFVTFKEEQSIKLNSAFATGKLPSGSTSTDTVSDLDIHVGDTIVHSYLKLENILVSGPKILREGQLSYWEYTLKITNVGEIPITNITVTDNILVDKIININNLSLSQGNIIKEDDTIIWNIELLNKGQYATANFKVEGFFNADGVRFISRSFSTGSSNIGSVSTDIIHSQSIEVKKGIYITNTMVSGPMEVNIGEKNTWRVEVKISNLSDENILDILIVNNILIDKINSVKIVNISNGTVSLCESKILWSIDELKNNETSILILDIIGSFNSYGCKNLNTTLGIGQISDYIIFSNIAKDFQIITYPVSTIVSDGLFLEKYIINEPLAGLLDTFKKWSFSIKITNLTNNILKNVIITDHILFDEFEYICILSSSSGNICIFDNLITWNIDELLPGKSSIATFEIKGLFKTTGLRTISRAVATAHNPKSNCCILSNICYGKSISIYDPIKDLVKSCISIDKIFSRYQQRKCIEDMVVYIGENDYEKIVFKSGFILKDTLTITDIKNNPNFKKVKFQLKVPFQIVTTKGTIIEDYLPNIFIDLIMYIPEARDEFSFNIDVETSSFLLYTPIKENNQLRFPVGVFIIIKAVGKVMLILPTYEFSSRPFELKKVDDDFIYNIDKLNIINNIYPLQNLSNNEKSSKIIQGNPCPNIFGRLKINKSIVCGPLKVASNETHTWIVEIRITNYGNGPICNVTMIDTLLLNKLIDYKIINLTHGDINQQDIKIKWGIGTLYSNETAVLLAEITGSFYNMNNNILKGESNQYNTVSDGVRKVYTNDDEITVYGNLGIPDPNEVSFLNLYVNGVLQPKSNYIVEKGFLTLLTNNTAIKGTPIIIEYFKIKNKNEEILKADVYQYNTIAKGKTVYTNEDELIIYGNKGIIDPSQTSYINLFINGVIQPKTNYLVEEGILKLTSELLPIEGAPIILQFISLT